MFPAPEAMIAHLKLMIEKMQRELYGQRSERKARIKAHDLIASPAFIVTEAADEFKDKTTAPNQLWQTDFTYLKVIGWGWFYLSTVLDDFSRYIVAWKLCSTMKAQDVTATLDLALKASGLRLFRLEISKNILDQDHRRIDGNPEVNCTQ
jgi:transposase InsO family protein